MVIIKQIGGTDDWGMYTSPTQTNANANPIEMDQKYDSTNGEQGSTGGRQTDFNAGIHPQTVAVLQGQKTRISCQVIPALQMAVTRLSTD